MAYESQSPILEHQIAGQNLVDDNFDPALTSGGAPGPEDQPDDSDLIQAPLPVDNLEDAHDDS